MPALPIVVIAEQGYSLPNWFIGLIYIFGMLFVLLCPFFFIKNFLKGDNSKNEK